MSWLRRIHCALKVRLHSGPRADYLCNSFLAVDFCDVTTGFRSCPKPVRAWGKPVESEYISSISELVYVLSQSSHSCFMQRWYICRFLTFLSVNICRPHHPLYSSGVRFGSWGGQQEEALIFSETSGSDFATKNRSRPPPRRIRSTALGGGSGEEKDGVWLHEAQQS